MIVVGMVELELQSRGITTFWNGILLYRFSLMYIVYYCNITSHQIFY